MCFNVGCKIVTHISFGSSPFFFSDRGILFDNVVIHKWYLLKHRNAGQAFEIFVPFEKGETSLRSMSATRNIGSCRRRASRIFGQSEHSKKTITNWRAVLKDFIRFYSVNPQYVYETVQPKLTMGYYHPLSRIPEYLYDDYIPNTACLEGYLQRKQETCTEQTVLSARAVLFDFHDFCYQSGYIKENPHKNIRKSDRMKKQAEENDILALVLRMTSPRDKLLVVLLYATGARISELDGMKIENINWENGTMKVYTPRGKARTLYCGNNALKQLREYLNGRQEGYVFCGSKGKHLTPRAAQLTLEQEPQTALHRK